MKLHKLTSTQYKIRRYKYSSPAPPGARINKECFVFEIAHILWLSRVVLVYPFKRVQPKNHTSILLYSNQEKQNTHCVKQFFDFALYCENNGIRFLVTSNFNCRAPPSLNLLSNIKSSKRCVSICCAIDRQTWRNSFFCKLFSNWCRRLDRTSNMGHAVGVKQRLRKSVETFIRNQLKKSE